MASSSQQGEAVLESQHLKKRKRSSSENSSNAENSDSESQNDSSTQLSTENSNSVDNSNSKSDQFSIKIIEKIAPKKRKYTFTTDCVSPKKSRKFYFLNEQATKPRRPKVTKCDKIEEEKQETAPGKKHKLHFAKLDSNGNAYLVHRLHLKSDLFFNDEKKYNYEGFKKLDLAFHIVDEIALEGLDGITIEAFWKRLKNVFPNNISKTIADRIWRVVCNNKRINFYILKEPREELIFFDRCKYLDIDSGMFLEPFIEFKDIYPMSSVNGTEIRGSCSTFDTRKENNGVRKFSMDKAKKLYDQKLVFVADQTLRKKALINEEADPNIELQDVEYCMLEKIGRSREQGEFTQGKMSLINDSKKVYHNRKVLTQNFLIVHQSFSLKSFALQQNISGGLVHLMRFYHKRKTKQIAIMERIAQILKSKPNHQIEFTEFRKIFGRNVSIVKLIKTAEFRKFFKLHTLLYRKLYPNASKHEYLNKNKTKERQLKVLRMIDPYANVTVLMNAKESKEVLQEKADESPGHKLINCEYLRDMFNYILSTGRVGATIHEIHEYFKTDFYSVRMAVRKLATRNVINSSKIDLGRQQSLKFTAKCFGVPDCHIKTKPKTYELTEETLSRVLKPYDNKIVSNEPEIPIEAVPLQTQFKLEFEPFCCTSFLTETVNAYSDELTIYDIVSKGRDKLLLIQSNLFANYISEWDDFLLKRDGFSKAIQLFQSGFGKVIYDFLVTLRMGDNIQTDNHIVFNLNNLTTDTKIARQFNIQRMFTLPENYINPHSGNRHIETVSKIYLFEAMFNETHKPNRCVDKLKNTFERLMLLEGKTKRKTEEIAIKTELKIEVEVSNSVLMEKFMGPQPVLEFTGQEEEITIEIFSSTKPQQLIETGTMFCTDDDNLTQRYINRANLILNHVYDQKIVQEVQTLYKDVLKEEDEEGYDKRACKKSIVSIVSKLVSDGYIKCYKLVMNGKNTTRTQCFICINEINSNEDVIKSKIEQLKLKFYVGAPNIQKITIKKKTESPFSSNDVKESITELKQLTNFKTELSLQLDKTKGKIYGYAPKYARMRILHEHLFYVIRELTETEPLTNRQVFELCKNLKIKVSQNDITEMPRVYRNEVSWKMFIPAMPLHSKWPKGWALACDIVLRMPLSVFVKLYNISYDIPELEDYLNHPIKRHYLVKHLSINIRNVLLYRRKYFHSIYETICLLCYIGLVQLGPRNSKEKDQLFLYLNLKGALFDTCNSKPGYNLIENIKYKKIPIEFKSGNDVEIYWSEMLRICMNTPLGKRKILDGQSVTIEECSSKPAMMETIKPKTFDAAVQNDNGKIPGDRRGSAGLDSSLWSFVKRNWVWNSPTAKLKTIQDVTGLKKEKYDLALPEPIQYDLIAKGGPPERKIFLKHGKVKKKASKSSVLKKSSRKKFVRKIVAQRKKKVREYCDATDALIMKKNLRIRVDWSDDEDQLLRYCRVASLFLCPEFKKQFIPYNILRDVLHKIHPKSKNKTARAIQRRIYTLVNNDETMKIMETNIENLLNSDTISKYFEQIHNRYKNEVKFNDSHIYILFIYLVAYICKHRKEVELLLLGFFASFDFFSDANKADFVNLLQFCEDANNSVIYNNPKTVEDITRDTIRSVMHCSMACRKNSVGWTFRLTRIYKKFPDELIRTTVNTLKKEQFFVQNKNFEHKNVDSAWPTPIKFSHVYNLMKTSSYTSQMYSEAYKNFANLISSCDSEMIGFIDCNEVCSIWEKTNFVFDIPEMGIILSPEIEDHSEVIEELAQRFRIYLDQINEKNNILKNKALQLEKEQNSEEKNIEEIKNEVKHLIFRVPYLLEENLEMYFKKMLDSNSNLEISNYIFLMIVDLKKSVQTSLISENLKRFIEELDENDREDQKKLVKNLSRVVFAIQSMHQHQDDANSDDESFYEKAFKTWEREIWQEVRTKNDDGNVVDKALFNKQYAGGMENCIKRAQEGDFPSLEEIKEGIMTEVENTEDRKIPHITDLIMLLDEDRFPDLDTDIETIERMKDHFVMQYPTLNQLVIDDLEDMKTCKEIRKIMNESKVSEIKKITENFAQTPQLDQIIRYINANNGTDADIKNTENLIDFIKKGKDLGVSAQQLKAKFMDFMSLDFVKLLQFLTEINVILRTGVASIIYVYYEFQSEWLTETFTLTSKEKEVFKSKQKQQIDKNLKSWLGESIQSSEPRKAQLKPWTHLDGSINDEVFNEWLCIILSRCVDFPYIPFLTLCEQFHYIKPVDIYFLLEVLQELGCVEIFVLKCAKNSLFSKRTVMNECKATCLDNFDEMFVKATNMSGLCFGSFLNMGCLE